MDNTGNSMSYGNLKSSMNYSTMSLFSVNSVNISTISKQIDFDSKEFIFCLTNKSLIHNRELMAAIQYLNPEYTIAENEEDINRYSEERRKYFFICDSFETDYFKLLHKRRCRMCAPPFLIYIHNRKRNIPETSRPLYNGSMFGVAVCFTGFATKRHAVTELADLVHYMGGSVRKDFSGKITHIVANLAQGQKYKAAVNLGKNIMTEAWIREAWENRNDPYFKATKKEFIDEHQMKPFHGLTLTFVGFSEEESKHMQEITVQNGGTHVELGNKECSHLVIEDSYQGSLPEEMLQAINVVKQEWFWTSIQLDACAEESLYFYINDLGTPLGIGTQRNKKKRKFLNVSDIILSPGSPYVHQSKRHSKEGRLSVVSSATFDSSLGSPFVDINFDSPDVTEPANKKSLTARQQTCLELQQTERNYVKVLETIIKVFKEPIEESSTQRGGPLLATEEIKTIFGAIPDLLEVHLKLLENVDRLLTNWNEEQLIGKAIVDCAEQMIKAYPGFVNYFEIIKETITKCDKEKPRFHAFLKICLSKPDCGRQTLTELLIRPVQRLPSMGLLLNDIKKHTPTENPDHAYLIKAADAIKNVLTHINEAKRNTEHQVKMFEIIHEVDNCPPYLLSSNRTLVSRLDIVEVSEGLITKNEHMTMFLFNDSIEIAAFQRKNRTVASSVVLKSPAIQNNQRTGQKPYRHVEFIHLDNVESMVDVKDDDEYRDMFGFIYHSTTEDKEKLSIFKLMGSIVKSEYLSKIMKCLTETKQVNESENMLVVIEAVELLNDKNDSSDCGKEKSGSISKVLKKAKGGIGKKFVKAFSLNKTPKHLRNGSRVTSSANPLHEISNSQRTPNRSSPTPSITSMMDFN